MQSDFCELEADKLPAQLARLSGDEAVQQLSAWGDISLLNQPIISIVGSRDMSLYTQNAISMLASSLAAAGAVICSGGALGVDICALKAADSRAIAVLPSGLSNLYPRSNARALLNIANNGGLLLSEYSAFHQPQKYDFLQRNRIVVGLSSALIIAQAAPKSGTLNSANWARKLGISVYALAQPAGASDGSMQLVASQKARLIYDILGTCKELSEQLGLSALSLAERDEMLDFIGTGCSLEEAYSRFGERVFDYELDGKITIDGALVRVK